MAVRQEGYPIPVGRRAEKPRKTKRRGLSGVKSIAGIVTLAMVAGGAGIGAYEIAKSVEDGNNRPQPTPIGGGIGTESTPSPTPELIVTPAPEETPSIEPSLTPEPTPTASAPHIPTESLPPAERQKLQNTLDSWVSGKINVPDSKKFHYGLKPARLNIVDDEAQPKDWRPTFQGYYLGSELIDNHVIMYVGEEDKQGNNYYIPVNLGEVNKDRQVAVFKSQTGSILGGNGPDLKLWPVEDLYKNLDKKFAKHAISYLTTVEEAFTNDVSPHLSKTEFKAQLKVANQFSRWSLALANYSAPKRSYANEALQDKYPLVKGLINHRVTDFKADKMPYLYNLTVIDNNIF